MLPVLRRVSDREFAATDPKVYYPPPQLSQHESKRQPSSHDSVRNNKPKVGGGFKLSNTHQESVKGDGGNAYDSYNQHNTRTLNYLQKKNSKDLGQEIRLIERKIRQCQKKIEDEKQRKLQQGQKEGENRYDQNFEEIVRRELQLQGYRKEENKGFDYLTNPGGAPAEEIVENPTPEPQTQPVYMISDKIDKLERFYEYSLKKKFQRRQQLPHKACKRKTPKLYITQKTNALSKSGKPLSVQEHRFRVMTKETTPQQIYAVIPNFAVVKDNLSKNIIAYLGDYKPFIDKTKEKVNKEIKQVEQEIVVETTNKNVVVSN